MPTAKEHLNKQVTATSDGKNLGKIKEIYFDSKVTSITAVSLCSSSWLIRAFLCFLRRKRMIDRAKVQKLGVDTWLVERSDVVISPKKIVGYRGFVPASELQGRKITSEGGTEIATVDSVILDDDGKVKGFTLDKMPASGLLASRRAIAREAIISLGSKNNPMTTTLEEAESMSL